MYILDKNFDPMKRQNSWDDLTRSVIRKRIIEEVGSEHSFDFFDEEEARLLHIIVNILIPHDDGSINQVKIGEAIDRKIFKEDLGVKYGDDGEWRGDMYKKGIKEFNEKYQDRYGKKPLEDLAMNKLKKFIEYHIESDYESITTKFLRTLLSDSVSIYYSHPFSWSQIGFPGPAFPEGYAYLDCGEKNDSEPEYYES